MARTAERLRVPEARVGLQDAVTVIPASDTILESTQTALDEADAWLDGHPAE